MLVAEFKPIALPNLRPQHQEFTMSHPSPTQMFLNFSVGMGIDGSQLVLRALLESPVY